MTSCLFEKFFKLILLINWISSINGYAPKLILISFDAFRSDYLHPKLTPTMYQLAKEGVQTKTMKSCYTTKTFPNHFSIATGLYEENHGIINNLMYDPEFDSNFTQSNLEEKWWHDMPNVNPIWNVNEQFDEHISASSMWPGSAVSYDGKMPKYFEKFKRGLTFIERMDKAVEWLTFDVNPANFVLVYIDEPDEIAHKNGPFSVEVKEVLKNLDDSIKHLLTRLKETGLLEETNIIILSDHGMSEVSEERVIHLTKLCDSKDFLVSGVSPNLNLFFYDKSNIEKVYNQLLNASMKLPFKVYKKGEVPAHYHFNKHRRIGEIVLEANDGFEIVMKQNPESFDYLIAQDEIKRMNDLIESNKNKNETEAFKKMGIIEKFKDFAIRKNKSKLHIWGEHGYNNSISNMRPLFLANGPAFKKNYVHRTPFFNIDVYSLICSILHLNLNPNSNPNDLYCKNDGEPFRVKKMLKPIKYSGDPGYKEDQNSLNILFILLLGALLLFVSGLCFTLCTSAIRSGYKKRRELYNIRLDDDVVDIDLSQYTSHFKPKKYKFKYEEERENLLSNDNLDYV